MTKQTPPPPLPVQETTISRQTRNAFAATMVFILAIIANLIISARTALSLQSPRSIADSAIVFLFLIVTIFSARTIRAGKKDQGVLLLLASFSITLIVRNTLTAGLGTIFGALAIVVIPFIVLLTLKAERFDRALIIALVIGGFLVAYDLLIPFERQSVVTAEAVIRAASIVAAIVALVHFAILLQQRNSLLLSAKLTLGVVFLVLIPIIILQVVGMRTLTSTLGHRQNATLLHTAESGAKKIDNFFAEITEYGIGFEAEIPALAEYLASAKELDSEKTPALKEQALATLWSLQSQNARFFENEGVHSYALLDNEGWNILDTYAENIGFKEDDTEAFLRAYEDGKIYVSNTEYNPLLARTYISVSAPVHAADGEILGVLRAQYDASILHELLSEYEGFVGESSFAVLFNKVTIPTETTPQTVYIVISHGYDETWNYKTLTRIDGALVTNLQTSRLLPPGANANLTLGLPDLATGLRSIGHAPVFESLSPRADDPDYQEIVAAAQAETQPWIVAVSQELSVYNAPITEQQKALTLLAIVIALVAVSLGSFGGQMLTKPILELTETANQIASGNLDARAKISSSDEIGLLGTSFNSMSEQLSVLVESLEERVLARTQDLERRALQLQAAAEIGNVAASLRDLDELLLRATRLISERFGYYHAGIFLLDEKNEYAVLQAANSVGGQRMLARGHKLEVGAEGIVGYVTDSGEARIALDVGQDATFFDNPDMPSTHSEMALPLIAGGKILGALDIQSEESEAFQQADIITLQVLADQIAVSIENARLFVENQDTLSAIRRAYGEQSNIGWKELLQENKDFAYSSTKDGVISIDSGQLDTSALQTLDPGELLSEDDGATVLIPVNVRGKVIGSIRLSKEDAADWGNDEIELAKSLVQELGAAVDGARLYQETQKRADRERIVSEITNRMRETMDIDAVIRSATDEIYNVIDLEHVTIHLVTDEEAA